MGLRDGLAEGDGGGEIFWGNERERGKVGGFVFRLVDVNFEVAEDGPFDGGGGEGGFGVGMVEEEGDGGYAFGLERAYGSTGDLPKDSGSEGGRGAGTERDEALGTEACGTVEDGEVEDFAFGFARGF